MSDRARNREGPAGQLDAEAARWCSVMHGPDAEGQRDAFEAWLRRGALHRQAYNRMEEIFLLGAKLPPRLLAEAQLPAKARRLALLAGATAAVALGLVALSFARWQGGPGRLADTALASGEPHLRLTTMRVSSETFRLSDGSVVTLSPNSDLTVAYDDRLRLLHLARGRSDFRVHAQRRPFVVEARGSRVTAKETTFGVAIVAADTVRVAVQAGSVEVEAPAAASGRAPPRHLAAGQALDIASGEPTPGSTLARAGPVLPAQPRTVADLIAQANASAHGGPLVEVADPAYLSVTLGGDFQAHDPAVTAQRLALLFGLAIEDRPGRLILTRRAHIHH